MKDTRLKIENLITAKYQFRTIYKGAHPEAILAEECERRGSKRGALGVFYAGSGEYHEKSSGFDEAIMPLEIVVAVADLDKMFKDNRGESNADFLVETGFGIMAKLLANMNPDTNVFLETGGTGSPLNFSIQGEGGVSTFEIAVSYKKRFAKT